MCAECCDRCPSVSGMLLKAPRYGSSTCERTVEIREACHSLYIPLLKAPPIWSVVKTISKYASEIPHHFASSFVPDSKNPLKIRSAKNIQKRTNVKQWPWFGKAEQKKWLPLSPAVGWDLGESHSLSGRLGNRNLNVFTIWTVDEIKCSKHEDYSKEWRADTLKSVSRIVNFIFKSFLFFRSSQALFICYFWRKNNNPVLKDIKQFNKIQRAIARYANSYRIFAMRLH